MIGMVGGGYSMAWEMAYLYCHQTVCGLLKLGNARTWSKHRCSSSFMHCLNSIQLSKLIKLPGLCLIPIVFLNLRPGFLVKVWLLGISRRIAELREHECQAAVEDVMYMLICSKFYDIRVHLVPQLSKCVYNGRLEILPSKDWELESIHSFEVLEMIREHLNTFIGWRANSSVTDKWAVTQIPRLELCQVYTASVLYGYFLKSASLRHTLENNLFHVNSDLGRNAGSHFPISDLWTLGSRAAMFGRVLSTRSTSLSEVSSNQAKKLEGLRCYVMGFDLETLQMCAKPKSKEASNLIEKQSAALFGDQKTGLLQTNDVISTSFASLKRYVLEAIAFGSYLWDAEEYINNVYELEDN